MARRLRAFSGVVCFLALAWAVPADAAPDAGAPDPADGGVDGGSPDDAGPGYAVADGGTPGAIETSWCNDTEAYQCQRTPLLLFDKKVDAPFAFDYDSGWLPDDSSDVAIRFKLDIPAYTRVRMQGNMTAFWPEAIKIAAPPQRKTGILDFDYGIETHVMGKINVDILGAGVYEWEGDIPFVPMVDYHVKDTTGFDPWAYAPGVEANGFTQELTLIELSLLSLVGIPSWLAGGGLKLSAQGELRVTYVTDKMVITNTAGPLTDNEEITNTPWENGAWTEHYIHPEGHVNYVGVLHLIPALYVEILGFDFDLDLADWQFPIDIAEEQWIFDEQLIHVRLPDVRPPASTYIDYGGVEVGQQKLITVELPNIGEDMGVLAAAVDNGAFECLEPATTVQPGEIAKIPVVFTPQSEGYVTAQLIVMTNDPDTPEITITLNAQGTPYVLPPDDSDPEPDDPGEGGSGGSKPTKPKPTDNTPDTLPGISGTVGDNGSCGCRTAGLSDGYWGFSLVCIGAGVALSRRRSRTKKLSRNASF